MLRMISSSSRMVRTTVVHSSAVGRSMAGSGQHRSFSGDSHDDFKPKRTVLPTEMDDVLKLIQSQVKENDVMLYMKGTPSAPQCGFSGQAVRILNALGTDFSSVNVLEYPAIRDGIKAYSEWPTIPQLYVKGEFVGGCDIMTTMFKDGDLAKLMKDKKVPME